MKDRGDLEQVVVLSYRLFLHREPEADEIDFHVQNHVDGLPVNEVIRRIASSDEAEQRKEDERQSVRSQAIADAALEQPKFGSARLSDEEQSELVRTLYIAALEREAAQQEVGEWKVHLSAGLTVPDFVKMIINSEERRKRTRGLSTDGIFSIGEIVQIAFQEILGTGANSTEINSYSEAIRLGVMSEASFVMHLFHQRLAQLAAARAPKIEAASSAEPVVYMLGTNRTIPLSDWDSLPSVVAPPRFARSAPRTTSRPSVEVSAIASMYKGEQFIEPFLENITSQTIFRDRCELIIVDACSPEREIDIIRPYMDRFPNIRYYRTETRIGIYDAWNVGIKMARGKYITNTNMDDLRRVDSIELQYDCFETIGIPDVVYQDFLYSFEEGLSFEEIARRDIRCRLPIVTMNNLIVFNSPHNAPMWRRSLHDEIGWFDERYRSAGDCDFWLRCALAGKTFYKLNEPHIAYYWNPAGLSTNAETLGMVEHRNILKELGSRLVSKDLLSPYEAFRDDLDLDDRAPRPETSRYDLVHSKLLSLETHHAARPGALS